MYDYIDYNLYAKRCVFQVLWLWRRKWWYSMRGDWLEVWVDPKVELRFNYRWSNPWSFSPNSFFIVLSQNNLHFYIFKETKFSCSSFCIGYIHDVLVEYIHKNFQETKLGSTWPIRMNIRMVSTGLAGCFLLMSFLVFTCVPPPRKGNLNEPSKSFLVCS